MKIKNIIIAIIIALSLIGTTVFVCLVVLKDGEDTSDVGDASGDGTVSDVPNIDDGGWTDD